MSYQSETSKHRESILPFCAGMGLDIGFGGDPIHDRAIRMDLPEAYANTGSASVQLGGDCRHLSWFRDESLDYVYSSHVLEDFVEGETESILREWMRVLRVGGRLVLLLPDQQRYLAYCRATGQVDHATGVVGNSHHSIDHFSLEYVTGCVARIGGAEIETTIPELGEYSFLAVFRKIKGHAGEPEGEGASLEQKAQEAWREVGELRVRVRQLEGRLAFAQNASVWKHAGRKVKRWLKLS